MFHRRFFPAMDTDSCRQLYTTYIRPHLEYACQVWDPHQIKNISALESVQKFALRACSKQWDAPYELLLLDSNLPSLADRRKYLKLCTMYKLIHGLTDFPKSPISFKANPHGLSHINSYTLEGFRARTNCFASSFFPSTCTLWNSLTPDLLVSPYVSFKRLIQPTCTFTSI